MAKVKASAKCLICGLKTEKGICLKCLEDAEKDSKECVVYPGIKVDDRSAHQLEEQSLYNITADTMRYRHHILLLLSEIASGVGKDKCTCEGGK